MANNDAFLLLFTHSKKVARLIEAAKKFAVSDEPLLFTGATGTGKDFWAKACHQYSRRADKPFLAINCAALPEDVAESELFGHAIGAYPNALQEKTGFFEQAAGGSVLLDEIGEMPASMQTKLLRFINDGTFRRVGDDKQKSVDVRIMCSTQQDLQMLVKEGRFREDLYYRISVLPMHLPLLKDRKEDIPLLTEYFINQYTQKQDIAPITLTESALTKLMHYHWPGNIRQLKNVLSLAMTKMEGTCLIANDIVLSVEDSLNLNSNLNDTLSHTLPVGMIIDENTTLDEMCKQFERAILLKYYQTFPSSRKLAKRLGLSHTAIANKLREYGISK